ncbi:helix-turn-helix domain-containing protein [Telluribacter sp. SYSU D00476]|uniref:helix-turn-helix domain-containing protein n=1 Tax=Telluribacter sp. SYSU D00476 TaxID=2811430 RepID=UPI001FF1B067|nr:helix-turn-helix domain-containing protein [Telluribacter sp. SYSU D00476]
MLLATPIIMDQEVQDSFSVKLLQTCQDVESRPVRLRYNRIYLIVKASGAIQIDDGHYVLGANQLLLMATGQVKAFVEGVQLEGYEILFGNCFWEKAPASASNCKAVLFNNAEANQQLHISPADLQELLFLFRALYQENEKPGYSNKLDALAAYLKIIMIKIANINASLHQGYDDEEKQLYRQYIELVSTQYKLRHEVAGFADQLHITARKLTEICKRSSGKGAKEIINGQLIAEAKRSLLFSASPVKEIAFALNFTSPEQFSHFFKKNTGIAPHEFRRVYVDSDR